MVHLVLSPIHLHKQIIVCLIHWLCTIKGFGTKYEFMNLQCNLCSFVFCIKIFSDKNTNHIHLLLPIISCPLSGDLGKNGCLHIILHSICLLHIYLILLQPLTSNFGLLFNWAVVYHFLPPVKCLPQILPSLVIFHMFGISAIAISNYQNFVGPLTLLIFRLCIFNF